MTLLEQIILCIIENYVNPLFEPIIIDCRFFNNIMDILDTTKINIKQLKNAKKQLLSNGTFSENTLKSNISRFFDVFIKIQEKYEVKIARLKSKNKFLKQQNRNLEARPTNTTNLMVDFNSCQQLNDAMTIYCTVK
jgi:DNA repair ATPase RecN